MNTLKQASRPSDASATSAKVEFAGPSIRLTSILVPIDFSRVSQKALAYAVPFAKQFGAKITLLHAIEPLPYTRDLTYLPMGERFPIGPLTKELDNLAKGAIEPGLLNEVIVKLGTPFDVITNVARDSQLILSSLQPTVILDLGTFSRPAQPNVSCGTLHVRCLWFENANTSSCSD
jgi:nucleotide-binding universal stress UspA family protein